MEPDHLVAACAGVSLAVERRDAEGDQAASKPAADKAKDDTKDPGHSALLLSGDLSHRVGATVLALHLAGLGRPQAVRVLALGVTHGLSGRLTDRHSCGRCGLGNLLVLRLLSHSGYCSSILF